MRRLWNIKYYFHRLSRMDWKGLFDALDYAHKQSKKFKPFLLVDMIWCSFKYTAGYTDYNEFEFYLLNSAQRKTYITTGQSSKAVKEYNDDNYIYLFDNKLNFNKTFNDYVHRGYIDLNETDSKGLEKFVLKHGKVMAKRPDDYVGRGIDKIDIKETANINYDELYVRLKENRQVLIEEFFTQHPTMSSLAPNSVNTIRMVTFVDDDGMARLLVAALKAGTGGHLDNIGQGGMYTILDENGTVVRPFIDKNGDHHSIHPTTQMNLMGFRVPDFQKLVEQVKSACLVIPQVRYIGWDVAVNMDGDVELIEGNTSTGPFQVIPSLSTNKIGIRPEFEKYMKMKF